MVTQLQKLRGYGYPTHKKNKGVWLPNSFFSLELGFTIE